MQKAYIERTLEAVVVRAVAEFPAVVLTGPRQSGKTTLLQHLLQRTHRYVSLEVPEVRRSASLDPRGFMDQHPPPVILDEVQNAPHLLSHVKERIDSRRNEHGQYILTGSQNLLMMEQVTQTLAGRAAILKLMPFSRRELQGRPDLPVPWESGQPISASSGFTGGRLWDRLIRGWYPEVALDAGRDVSLWHDSYVQTYLERDVRSVRHVGDLALFQSFIASLALRSGQLLNLTDIARDLGLAVNTIKQWLSVLEATFLVVRVRPYFVNVGKRLVKRPKVYFTDTGTLCHLLHEKDAGQAASGAQAGRIFETAVVSEVVKTFAHAGRQPRIYFWRTSNGNEVDVVIDLGARLIPVEAKASTTPQPRMAQGIERFRGDYGDRVAPGYVVHPGDVRLPIMPGVTALPFGAF